VLTAAPAASSNLEAVARAVSGSFRLLSASEKASLKPLRIRVVTVRAGDTVGSLAASMVGVDRKLDLFRVLNALPPGATLSAGDKVKIVSEG
jgi:predicted Zn-dependent protease